MNTEQIIKELVFRTSRSSGAGGQHVNKTESRVELVFAVDDSEGLEAFEKVRIHKRLSGYIDSAGLMHMYCDSHRSQHRNKKLVIERLMVSLEEALKEQKERKPTKPSLAAKRKRLQKKKIRSDVKQNRRWRLDD